MAERIAGVRPTVKLRDVDPLEIAASEWLMLRPAGAPRTGAVRLVERALAAAYLRRNPESATARRVARG